MMKADTSPDIFFSEVLQLRDDLNDVGEVVFNKRSTTFILDQCCRVAIICGLSSKFSKNYFMVFHHYPLATLATPGRREGHDLWFRG